LIGASNEKSHLLNWTIESDEAIKNFDVQYSFDGSSFENLFTVGSSKFAASYKPPPINKIFYRVKAITVAAEIAYYSNVISLDSPSKDRVITCVNSIVNDYIKLTSETNCEFELMLSNGQVILRGKVYKGSNKIAVPANAKGLYLLRFIDANEVWTQRIIKQ
jgi:hypothetical protein